MCMVAHVVASLFGLCVFARMHIYTGVFMYACVLCVFCVELWVLACLQVWLCMCSCVFAYLCDCLLVVMFAIVGMVVCLCG